MSELNVLNTPLEVYFQLLYEGLMKVTPSSVINVSEICPIVELMVEDPDFVEKGLQKMR